MTRAKPGLVVNFGLLLVVAWALVVAASEPSAREPYFECYARCHGETGQGDGLNDDQIHALIHLRAALLRQPAFSCPRIAAKTQPESVMAQRLAR
jgi:hypothetical protein